MPPLNFFSGFRFSDADIYLQRLGGSRVSQLMTLFVEVGVEAKLGLQDLPDFLRRSKETNLGLRYGYMIYTTLSIFLCLFFCWHFQEIS